LDNPGIRRDFQAGIASDGESLIDQVMLFLEYQVNESAVEYVKRVEPVTYDPAWPDYVITAYQNKKRDMLKQTGIGPRSDLPPQQHTGIHPNAIVKLKPTDAGWREITALTMDLNAHIAAAHPNHAMRIAMPEADVDGYITGHFWSLMAFFDWSRGAVGECPFEDLRPANPEVPEVASLKAKVAELEKALEQSNTLRREWIDTAEHRAKVYIAKVCELEHQLRMAKHDAETAKDFKNGTHVRNYKQMQDAIGLLKRSMACFKAARSGVLPPELDLDTVVSQFLAMNEDAEAS
jgi:hypothetical protein